MSKTISQATAAPRVANTYGTKCIMAKFKLGDVRSRNSSKLVAQQI